jgi:ATP-binding cassette subfamily B protein
MSQTKANKKEIKSGQPSVFSLLKDYKKLITSLIVLGIITNGLSLFIPKLVSKTIDSYIGGFFNSGTLILQFTFISVGIFLFTYLQTIVQTYTSEQVGRDVRSKIIDKISRQNYRFIEDKTPAKLLTNVTSDIDSIKMFVSQAIVSLVSSVVIILGVTIILLTIDWKLALAVLTIIPIIGITFFVILKLVTKLFTESREVIDWLNKVINESIVGAALIRVLHSESFEDKKFTAANARAKDIGMGILKLFSFMIPIITFVSSLGTLIVMTLGGYYVINNSMTLGSFAAFNSYIVLLIFPILVIGFISNIVAQASASYARIHNILEAPDEKTDGTISTTLNGKIEIKNATLLYGERYALKDVSLSIKPGTKTAIIGPTGAGKTQLLNVMTGLTAPQKGLITYDDEPLSEYKRDHFFPQIGLVFQDSVLFNTTLRENIAFSTTVTNDSLAKAVATAEIEDFVKSLPQGLDTIISERGTSLSGGQKQRLMLARALALDPKILFLDDFTARVDNQTESKILSNIEKNYPDITLISITQKISSIEKYDQIILLMEGEILAHGTHEYLMESSPEYVQIYDSQRSTNTYELRT